LVVHCGIGPNRGHYIAVVKRDGSWLVFDDETVDVRIQNFDFIEICMNHFFSSDLIRPILKNSMEFLMILVDNQKRVIFYFMKVEMFEKKHEEDQFSLIIFFVLILHKKNYSNERTKMSIISVYWKKNMTDM
jgi:hypothetical protein